VIATSIGLLALAPAMANGKPTASRIVVNCYQNETTLVWGEVGPVTDSFKLGGDSSPWLDTRADRHPATPTWKTLTWHGHNMQQWVELAGTEFDVTG
jgi:hypothetical protein